MTKTPFVNQVTKNFVAIVFVTVIMVFLDQHEAARLQSLIMIIVVVFRLIMLMSSLFLLLFYLSLLLWLFPAGMQRRPGTTH